MSLRNLYYSLGHKEQHLGSISWPSQMKTWAVKTTALACENIMLSARAHGYDSLPMEGYDGKKLKSFLGLSKHQHLVMVIALG